MANTPLVIRVAANLEELRTNLAEGINQIETTSSAMKRLATAYDGSKAIAEAGAVMAAIHALGGATTLTAAEQAKANRVLEDALEKYKALGREAPPGMRELANETKRTADAGGLLDSTFTHVLAALSASALISRASSALTSLATEALATASGLVDLSNKTGLSTETLQRMSYVAKQNGSDVNTFADAVFKMGVTIAEGTAKARKGAEDLGLSWKELRAASPDQQFNMVVSALERMEDPQKRNEAAVALFGKSASAILPAIVDDYNKIAAGANVAGDAQVRAAANAANAWEAFKSRVGALFLQSAGDFLLLRDAVAKLSDQEKAFILAMMPAGATIEEYDAALIKAAAAHADVNLKVEKAVEVQKTFVDELIASAKEYAALTEEQRANIRAAIDLGKSNDEIVNGLGITDATLNLLKKSWQEEATAATKAAAEIKKNLEERNKGFEQSAAIQTKLINDILTNQRKADASQNELAQIALEERMNAEIAAVQKNTKLTDEEIATALTLIKAKYKDLVDAIGIDYAAISAHSLRSAEDQRDNALKTYQAMVASGGATREELDKQMQKYRDLAFAATAAGRAAVEGEDAATAAAKKHNDELDKQKKAIDAAAAAEAAKMHLGGSVEFDFATPEGRAHVPADIAMWLRYGYSLAQAARLQAAYGAQGWGAVFQIINDPINNPPGPRVPGFASGVENFGGGLAMVGERGPELVNLPRGSDVIPFGSGAGGVVINVHVHGGVYGAGGIAQLGRDIGAAHMAELKSHGLRLPMTGSG